MIYFILYFVVGYIVAKIFSKTIEGNSIFESLSEDEQTSYFLEVTFTWPIYLFKI